ncbi:hypothetical protein R75461_01173 [Paraburkholderia nemoris]|uniref:hypothetical protein n=1 Tax=Paraburkholderia nemoris TaxID=2793076 RepID=UPI001B10ED6E|nr:hypothetical protein [Paraburkholderia nemoris]CAE6713530.1 hypothetical protein R75461_01173 [Paraburkholderia nemoris]
MTTKKSTELTVIERAAVALGTSEREANVRELVAQSVTIVEIKNGAARDQAHGALMALRNTRTDITKAGKSARDDANAFSKAVIAEEKRLVSIIEPEETRLLTLRDAWDEAREAEKRAKAEAEARRIALIREHIEDIRTIAVRATGRSAAEIEIEITDLVALLIDVPRFAELTGEAEMARGATLDKLRSLHAAALAQEAEAKRLAEERAELAKLRAEQEERDRIAAASRAEQEEKIRAAREAEDAARREAQRKADDAIRAEREAHEKRMAAERAEMQRQQEEAAAEQRRRQQKIDAEQAAARAELQRQQDELAAQRRAEADAAAAKQREADLAAAKAAREQAEHEAEVRRIRDEADTKIRNAAHLLLNACIAALTECPNLKCASQLRTAIDEAGAEYFLEVPQLEDEDLPF